MTSVYRAALVLLAMIGWTASTACATSRHLNSLSSAAVFRHQDDMLGCDEIGLIAKTDGCFREVPACCAAQRHSSPSEAGAVRRLAAAAAKMGGNAVLLLHVSHQKRVTTHCETCCDPEVYRAYGIVFRCEESDLRWHQRHESDPNG